MRDKIKFLLILFTLLLCFNITTYGQISEGGQPLSLSKSLSNIFETKEMPYVDTDALLAEDELEQFKDVPLRFGAPFEVDYNMENSGTWERIPDGTNIWRLKIISQGAYSINLVYDYFEIPKGAKLFVYNEDKSMIIGAFTYHNNKEYQKFATGLVKGDVTIIEYIEPADVEFPGMISIERVVHAYRNLFSYEFAKEYLDFGSSGSCNNNVNCPEGDDWKDQIRAAAMILTGGGFRLCSGSLINNVRQDLTPYFLTANHCLGGEDTWIFMFNYESPSCDNIDGPTWMTVQGSSLKASVSFSDFGLLLLDEQPPDSYNVYYSGWSAVDTGADSCVAIHHPSGDIKKISFNFDKLTSTSYLGTSAGDGSHWRVDNWEDGTTEPGSSGSPIYDYNHRIVGQLHGGYASCTSITSDWYGKVSISWNYGSSASSRLKDWLDPDNTGVLVLDGIDGAGVKITHTPLEDTKDSDNDYRVLATITSNVALVPSSLAIYYQTTGGWDQIIMSTTGNLNEYDGFIPAQVPGTVIDYYLQAEDIEGKADTTDIYTFKVLDYGFTMSPDYQEKNVGVNDTAWYIMDITNIAVYDDDYSLSMAGNFWNTSFWDASGMTEIYSTGLLAADATFVFKVRVIVPASLSGDFDETTITATSTGDPSLTVSSIVKTISAGEPFQIPFEDNFVDNFVDLGYWTTVINAESNSDHISAPSEPYSLNLDGHPNGEDTVVSQIIDLRNKSNVNLSFYYQRTGGGNSPETGDDLFIEYLNDIGSWDLLSQQLGSGVDMTTFEYVEVSLPIDAYHSAFKLRIRNIGTPGTTGSYDDWFVDNILLDASFICGDINGDGAGPLISDLTYFVDYMLNSGPPPPIMESADVNGDSDYTISDITYIVAYLFQNGPLPICK